MRSSFAEGASFSSSNVQFNLEDFRVERTSEASSCKLELFKLIMDRQDRQDRQAKSYRRDEHQSTYNAIYTKREFDEDRWNYETRVAHNLIEVISMEKREKKK